MKLGSSWCQSHALVVMAVGCYQGCVSIPRTLRFYVHRRRVVVAQSEFVDSTRSRQVIHGRSPSRAVKMS